MNTLHSSSLFLADSTPILVGAIIGVVSVLVAIIGAILWVRSYKNKTEQQVGSAKQQSEKLLSDAKAEAGKIVSRG